MKSTLSPLYGKTNVGLVGYVAVIGILVLNSAGDAAANVAFFDDGTGTTLVGPGMTATPVTPFGDVSVGVQFKDDLLISAPSTNTNRSYVFHYDETTGKVGGGVHVRINFDGGIGGGGPGAQRGVIVAAAGDGNTPRIETYGSKAKKPKTAGRNWQAKFDFLAEDTPLPPDLKATRWKELVKQFKAGEISIKVKKYDKTFINSATGEEEGEAPVPEEDPNHTDPTDPGYIETLLFGRSEGLIFWEVPDGNLDYMDLYIGDLEQPIAFEQLNHHLPYFSVLTDVGPADLGIDPADAFNFTFTRTGNIDINGRFGVEAVTEFADPAVVPIPAAIWLFGSGLLGLIGIAKRKKS